MRSTAPRLRRIGARRRATWLLVAAVLAGGLSSAPAVAQVTRERVSSLEEALRRQDRQLDRQQQSLLALRDRVTKFEAKIPNQERTFIFGLIAGLATVVVGQLLAAGFTWWRERENRRRREQAVLAASLQELDNIAASVTQNKRTVVRELHALDQDQQVAGPLILFDLESLDSLRAEPPRKLFRNSVLFGELGLLTVTAKNANRLSEARSGIQAAAGPNVPGLRAIDERLNEIFDAIPARAQSLKSDLEALKQ